MLIGFLSVAYLGSALAWSSPCCSAGSAMPALITGDSIAQFSVSQSLNRVAMDAGEGGLPVLRASDRRDESRQTRLAGAWRLGERWQIAAGTAVISRSVGLGTGADASAAGWGDSDVSAGYEILPEWTYSPWRPHGYLYFQGVLPSGRAAQDPGLRTAAEVRGYGVFQTALGAALFKNFSRWDVSAVPELRRFHPRGFGGGISVSGGWGAALQLGAGYSPPASGLRVGMRIQPSWQEARTASYEQAFSRTLSKLVWTSGVDVSWMASDAWILALAYSDQTLWGPSRNSSLERGLGVSVQHRWEP